MASILIVEDETRISSFIDKGLSAAGYQCTVTASGEEAIEYLSSRVFDLVVLDVGLPDIDGFEVLRRVRESGNTTPIIMLTARTSTKDVVHGLGQGANDYMPKPFPFDELLARIKLRIKTEDQLVSETVLEAAGASLDLKSRTVTVAGRTMDLSAREFALAEEFFRHPDQVLSREQLLSRVWGYDFDPGSNVVDVYVRYLRNKLGKDSIETVRGMGYRLSTSE